MADLDKDKRIKKKIALLNKMFKILDEDRKKIVNDLIANIAFMSVQLEDLQAEINANGCTEKYCNGVNQYGTKQSSAFQAYTALIKNYQTALKQLLNELPKNESPKKDDFDSFLMQK